MENSRNKIIDKVLLLAGIIIFLALMGGSLSEYRRYRLGLEDISKTKSYITELQQRKERLEKLFTESQKPEYVEKQLREKLGLVVEEGEYVATPTSEPKVIDLRMEEKSVMRKMYWGEWWELLR